MGFVSHAAELKSARNALLLLDSIVFCYPSLALTVLRDRVLPLLLVRTWVFSIPPLPFIDDNLPLVEAPIITR